MTVNEDSSNIVTLGMHFGDQQNGSVKRNDVRVPFSNKGVSENVSRKLPVDNCSYCCCQNDNDSHTEYFLIVLCLCSKDLIVTFSVMEIVFL